MAQNADVRSLEQLEVFLEHAKHFRSQLIKEIENLQVELRRLTDWIETDAAGYWQQQLVKAQRQFVEAQDALTRCMSYVREEERRPCTEEKKRLKLAKDRRNLCEEKQKTARAAAAAWDRDRSKNQGKVQRCRDLAESDLTVAIHHLEGQIERLTEYASLRSSSVRTDIHNSKPSSKEESEPDDVHKE